MTRHQLPILKKIIVVFALLCACVRSEVNAQQKKTRFRNSNLSLTERVNDLLNNLTLEEKISLLGYRSKEVARLNIPAYNWWNEALHGVARAGQATVFPQAIAMAATFNDSLINRVADAISTEARAKYNLTTALDRRQQYMGLTFWSPNINLFRDPRWGRGQETYGEDPFLTAAMGVAFVKGMQGNDPYYLKTSACAKHFAVHSGPEATRHTFNAIVDEKDLRETYLYAFKKLVDGGVESVMCAYNRLNNQPCCTSDKLLHQILRKEWKFRGHLVTDCWALEDIWRTHKVMKNSVEVAAAALKAGINLDCSNMLQEDLLKAYEQKLITKADVDSALAAILRTQFRLGFYDDKSKVPYSTLGEGDVHSQTNIHLARTVAQQSMVLLKNDKQLLPLDRGKVGSITILGPGAGSADALLGNYHGMSGNLVTFAEGIVQAAGPAIGVQYDQGSDYTDTTHFGGIWAASESDVAIAVIGLSPVYEGEEGDAFLSPHAGDKTSLSLPTAHINLLKKLKRKGNPVIAIVTGGSAVDIAAISPYADAIIFAWYAGEQGGVACADILFGDVSPSGRLPITFYNSLNDLPAYDDYKPQGRTYRYFHGKVQYPFGFGMSYTSFGYEWKQQPQLSVSEKDTLTFSVAIRNTGLFDGDEVMQAYIQFPPLERMPIRELKGFKRVHVKKGEEAIVQFRLPATELLKWEMKGNRWKLYEGEYKLVVGANAEDNKLSNVFQVK